MATGGEDERDLFYHEAEPGLKACCACASDKKPALPRQGRAGLSRQTWSAKTFLWLETKKPLAAPKGGDWRDKR